MLHNAEVYLCTMLAEHNMKVPTTTTYTLTLVIGPYLDGDANSTISQAQLVLMWVGNANENTVLELSRNTKIIIIPIPGIVFTKTIMSLHAAYHNR